MYKNIVFIVFALDMEDSSKFPLPLCSIEQTMKLGEEGRKLKLEKDDSKHPVIRLSELASLKRKSFRRKIA